MSKKKNECICDQCPKRFVCFTQRKVFSDPAYQAMYEAFIEEGLEHKAAVGAVRRFIESQKIEEKQEKYDAKDWKRDKWYDKKWEDYRTEWTHNPDMEKIADAKYNFQKEMKDLYNTLYKGKE